jgi:hypothetical protein
MVSVPRLFKTFDASLSYSSAGENILKYTAGTWTVDLATFPLRVVSIWADATSNIIVVGYNVVTGDAYALQWDGGSWNNISPAADPDQSLYSINGLDPTDLVAVGFNGTVLRWDGAAWTDETIASMKSAAEWVRDVSYTSAPPAALQFDNFDPSDNATNIAASKVASFDVTAGVGVDPVGTLIQVNGTLAYENETELNGFSIVRSVIASGYHYEITPPDGWANGSIVVIDLAAKDTASALAVGGWSFSIVSSSDCFDGPLNATEEALLSPFASLDYNERLRQSLLLASVTRPDPTTAARVIFLRGHSQELAPVLREMVPTPTAAEQASRLCYRATNLQVSNVLRRKVNLLPGAIRELQGLGLPRQHAELLNAYEREDQPNTEAPLACLIVLLAKALV